MKELERRHRKVDRMLRRVKKAIPDKTGMQVLKALQPAPPVYQTTRRVLAVQDLLKLLRKEAKGKLLNPLVIAYEIGIIKAYLQDLDGKLVTLTPQARMGAFGEYKELIDLIKIFEREMIKSHKRLRKSGKLRVDLIKPSGIVGTGMGSLEYTQIERK
jgi:hypothetical protein